MGSNRIRPDDLKNSLCSDEVFSRTFTDSGESIQYLNSEKMFYHFHLQNPCEEFHLIQFF